MAASRVTDAEVREICEIDAALTDLEPFRIAANYVVEDNLASVTFYTTSPGLSRLKEIERWLAAHFTAIRDKRIDSEKAGPVSQKFQYKLGLNLQSTMYGQQAIMLDKTGTLANLSMKGKRVVGRVTSINPEWVTK
jgi:hypothetical protein